MMNMLRLLFAGALAALSSGALGGESVGFIVRQDRPSAVYSLMEEAVFTVTATNGVGAAVTNGLVTVRVDDYGTRHVNEYEVDLSCANPFVVRDSLDGPGFLRLKLSGVGMRVALAGAAFSPEQIRPAGECPADFDEFWASARARMAQEVLLDPQIHHVPARSAGAFDFWRVSFAASCGKRIWGFLSVPKDKSKAPYPVNVEVASAGKGPWTANMDGKPDRICLYFTVHNFEPPDPPTQDALDKCHADLEKELMSEFGLSSYGAAGLGKSREDYYFYRQILAMDRAVDWLWERNDVDRARFHYRGGSQGGGFGWFLCGLNHKFTSAVLRVPAMSDILGDLEGRVPGFPYVLAKYADHPDRAVACRNAPYFNGAFFASRIRCPVRVAVGFVDEICPPTGVYAAYNNIRSADKAIAHGVSAGHGGWPGVVSLMAWQDKTDFSHKQKQQKGGANECK